MVGSWEVAPRDARLVADGEHGDLLALQVEAREVPVDELVPRRARALIVSARVPRGSTDDEAVISGHTIAVEVVDHDGLKARCLGEIPASGRPHAG